MYYAEIDENGKIKNIYNDKYKDVCPIPDGCVELPEEIFKEIYEARHLGEYEYVNGKFQKSQESLNIKKERKIMEFDKQTTNYILRFYPHNKQLSDISDKEYYTNIIINAGVDYIAANKKINTLVTSIENGEITLDDAVNDLIQTFTYNDTKAWEQVLKVALRVAWVQHCKEAFKKACDDVNAATTEEEIAQIVIQFPTPTQLR